MSDFLPSTDAELVTFSNNFNVKLDTYGAALGLTAPEIAAKKLPGSSIISAVANFGVAKTTYEGASTTKTTIINTSVTAIRSSAKDIKRSSAYTEAIGREFGIVGSSTHVDPETYKSSLKLLSHPDHVTIKFTKLGVEGINLYTRINGDLDWIKLGFYAHSPCVDARPLEKPGQPEKREYMCIGVMKDHQIGLESDIARIAFAG